MNVSRNAVVLLSGGMDSAVTLAMCRAEGFAAHALTVDYGQRHRHELDAARGVADALGVKKHITLAVDLTRWGGSALTGPEAVPTHRDPNEMGREIPVTYVPARNTIFLSLAMGWAETLRSGDIFIGAHTLDYSGYPDCRPEYFRAFELMANLATRLGVTGNAQFKIHTPLLLSTKADIVRHGTELRVPFELTISCYSPDTRGMACGICDSCILRKRAFEEAGMADPTRYTA
jgi:7-cyano-7-deazaguanine synthase